MRGCAVVTAPLSCIRCPLQSLHAPPQTYARYGILFRVADKNKASFIPPMLLVRTEKLPEGKDWLYELKLDGYRSIAFKTGGKVYLRSRNNKDFNASYPHIVKALANMPDETVIDGEVVALDQAGRPSFSALQNYGSSNNLIIIYYVFDVMVLERVDVMREPLSRRRELLEQKVLPNLIEPIKYSAELDSDPSDLIQSVKKLGLEGLVAKRRDSRYAPGLRTAAWWKTRVNAGQEFVIGGYTLGNPFDALVFGYYEGERLMYVARTRNGFTPASRQRLFERFRGLEGPDCPVRESTRGEERALGARTHERKDAGVPLDEARACRAI
jgi:DNA ligase D-like protein (predicted ligase)